MGRSLPSHAPVIGPGYSPRQSRVRTLRSARADLYARATIGLRQHVDRDLLLPARPDDDSATAVLRSDAHPFILRRADGLDPPLAAIYRCMGKVNQEPFDGARGSQIRWPAETLLMMTPQIQRSPRSLVGRVLWDIEYVFMVRDVRNRNTPDVPRGWNHYPAADGRFYPVEITNTGGEKIYKTADFNQLFVPPLPVEYQ